MIMLQYYVMDDTRRDKLDIAHFSRLRDAVQAYKDLPDWAREKLAGLRGSEQEQTDGPAQGGMEMR